MTLNHTSDINECEHVFMTNTIRAYCLQKRSDLVDKLQNKTRISATDAESGYHENVFVIQLLMLNLDIMYDLQNCVCTKLMRERTRKRERQTKTESK